jgi:hypothetical protein
MAIKFNKTAFTEGDYIKISSASQYDLTTAVSMMCWVKINTKNPSGVQATYVSRNDFINIQHDTTTDVLQFAYNYTTTWRTIQSTTTPTAGVWYHLVGTFDKSGTPFTGAVYVNGVQSTTSNNPTDTIQSTAGQTLNIGVKVSTTPVTFVQATIADVRLYNRALSANEISTVYACQGHDGIVSGLVGRWPLNEGIDGDTAVLSTFYDVSEYKNNGAKG